MYGSVVEAGSVPHGGNTPMWGTMSTKERSRYTNPRLREVEQSIAERAYTLRRYVKQGSPEYQRLSWAIQGNCSLATLALLVELDAKHEAGQLSAALSRTTHRAPDVPAPSNPSPSDD